MDIFEIEQKEILSREKRAERLHTIADMLAQHNDLEFERDGMHFTVHVPDEVQLELEIEERRAGVRDRDEAVSGSGHVRRC